MVASAEGKPWRAASEALQGDGESVQAAALEVSGEHAAGEGSLLGKSPGGRADGAVVLGEASAGLQGATAAVLGGRGGVLPEATSAPWLDTARSPSPAPPCWLS